MWSGLGEEPELVCHMGKVQMEGHLVQNRPYQHHQHEQNPQLPAHGHCVRQQLPSLFFAMMGDVWEAGGGGEGGSEGGHAARSVAWEGSGGGGGWQGCWG